MRAQGRVVGAGSGRRLGEKGSEAQTDLSIHAFFPSHLLPTGSRGREKGEFTNLQGVSAASSGRIVVADSNNQCIQVSLFTQLLQYQKGLTLWPSRFPPGR